MIESTCANIYILLKKTFAQHEYTQNKGLHNSGVNMWLMQLPPSGRRFTGQGWGILATMLFPSWLILQVINLNRLLSSPDLTSCVRHGDKYFLGKRWFSYVVIYWTASIPGAWLGIFVLFAVSTCQSWFVLFDWAFQGRKSLTKAAFWRLEQGIKFWPGNSFCLIFKTLAFCRHLLKYQAASL